MHTNKTDTKIRIRDLICGFVYGNKVEMGAEGARGVSQGAGGGLRRERLSCRERRNMQVFDSESIIFQEEERRGPYTYIK